MTFSLTVLGASGTYAAAGGACSGYLVRSGSTTVLMDAGPGTLANLQHHVALTDLDGIVLSHSHPDHWLELPVMRNALKYVLDRAGLELYSTAETLRLAEPLCSFELGRTFRPEVITDRTEFSIGDLAFRCSRTDHPVETLALAVSSNGSSLAYSADTGPGWSLSELAREVDLAVVEATFLDDTVTTGAVHLTARQAGETARQAGARALVLTHLLPGASVLDALEQGADAYGAAVDVAESHRTFGV